MLQKKTNPFIFTLYFIFIFYLSNLTAKTNDLGWDHENMYIDFATSMQVKKYAKAIARTKQVTEVDGIQLYKLFKRLYEKNNLTQVKPSKDPKIPKIIHVVWINGKVDDPSVPKELEKYIVTWKEKHPDWKFKLWTDADVAKITLDNQDLYENAVNFGVKSDILKYEIIYRYGGVYVDTDFESLRPLDHLHHCYDFYVGIQPLDTQYLQLGAALFAAKPGHKLLKHVIETMKESYYSHKGAPAKTGPIHFTRALFDIVEKLDTIDIAFPASYFYPLGGYEKIINRKKWEKLGAFAIHWWGMTWMPLQYRRGDFKKIQNQELIKDWNN
ncbi:glycosyltransferase family 32 protein [Candidatus Dependentiae bacterium]